jgi:hypothetical protein
MEFKRRKVSPAYSHALPIHAKSGRERGGQKARARLTTVGIDELRG